MKEISANLERRLVLASGSPRRLELLAGLGFEPIVRVAQIPEQQEPGEAPTRYASRLSLEKARAVCNRDGAELAGSVSPWVLGADTIVLLDDDVLEKPLDREQACSMLSRLSGKWHTVVTSFTVCALRDQEQFITKAVTAGVRFRDLDDSEISAYVASGEPMDKAGSYGIQRLGGFLVREIKGSYFAVVGLPVCEVGEVLCQLGAVSHFPFPVKGVE